MKACSGLKTLIYGTAAGIDPHRINRSKLPPWYIAGPCYRSPPCQFSPFPSRSALHAVGQSSRTALLLLPVYLTSNSPALVPPPLCPCAPITFQISWWLQPPSWSTIEVRGESTRWQHKMDIQGLEILSKPKGIQLFNYRCLRCVLIILASHNKNSVLYRAASSDYFHYRVIHQLFFDHLDYEMSCFSPTDSPTHKDIKFTEIYNAENC